MTAYKTFAALCRRTGVKLPPLRIIPPPPPSAARLWPPAVEAGDRSWPCSYQVLPAAHIFASDHENYPAALQPRSYASAHERAKLDRIALHPDPARLLSNTPLASEGPPTVWRHASLWDRWVVLNGNGRVMGLQRALQSGTAAAYTAALGSPGILVRIVDLPNTAAAAHFARLGNVPETQAQQGRELAASLAGLIESSALADFTMEPDETLGDVISLPRFAWLRGNILKALPASLRSAYFRDDESLTEEGRTLVRNMVFVAAFPGVQPGSARIIKQMESAVPHAGRLRQASPEAYAALAAALNHGPDNIAQGVFDYGRQIPEHAKPIVSFLDKIGNAQKVFGRLVLLLAEYAEQNGGLLGDPEPIPALIARAILRTGH